MRNVWFALLVSFPLLVWQCGGLERSQQRCHLWQPCGGSQCRQCHQRGLLSVPGWDVCHCWKVSLCGEDVGPRLPRHLPRKHACTSSGCGNGRRICLVPWAKLHCSFRKLWKILSVGCILSKFLWKRCWGLLERLLGMDKHFFEKNILLHIYILCICVSTSNMEVKGQLVGISSSLPS